MPIDFAAAAKQFEEAVKLEVRRSTLAQQAIAGPLGKRLTAATMVNASTRQFPIIRFYNGAPVMKITASQLGTLAVAMPPPSVAQGFVNGALGFARGFAEIWAPLKGDSAEGAFKRFAGTLNDALKEIEASMKRFEKPAPEMFDPRRAKGSDVFGLAALAFRALDEASIAGGELDMLTSQIARSMAIVRMGPPPTGNEEPQPYIEPGPARSLGENLDFAAYTLLGGIIVLSTLPTLIDLLFNGVLIRTKVWLLNEFTEIERSVLDFRRDMLRAAFYGVVESANNAINFLGGAHEILGANISFMLKFWRELGTQFATSVRDFVIALVDYFKDFFKFIDDLPTFLGAINAFDLTLLLRDKLGGVVDYVPSLKLDELLDSSGQMVNLNKYEEWMLVLDAASAALEGGDSLVGTLGGPIAKHLLSDKVEYGRRQIARTRKLMDALFPGASWNPMILGTTRTIPRAKFLPDAPPTDFKSDFPNLFETLMGSGRSAQLLKIIDDLKKSADFGLTEAIRRGRDGLGQMSEEFAKASQQATNFRDADRLKRAAESAKLLSDKIFGPEVDRERQGITDRTPDRMALAFQGWLAGGGFKLVGEVINVYVAQMAAYWREQIQHGEELTAPITPTSPHILRKRAVLGKVNVPRITLHTAPRRQLDEPLVEFMRDAFATAVERSYANGQRRLAEMAAAGPP